MPDATLIERLRQMDAATGLPKECLERATYLHAMADEGLSTIDKQVMQTLYSAAAALAAAEKRVAELEVGLARFAMVGEAMANDNLHDRDCFVLRFGREITDYIAWQHFKTAHTLLAAAPASSATCPGREAAASSPEAGVEPGALGRAPGKDL